MKNQGQAVVPEIDGDILLGVIMALNTEAVLAFRDVILRDIDESLALAKGRDRAMLQFEAEREGERNAREAMEKSCEHAHEVLGREHTPTERGEAVGDCREKEREYVKELSKP
jgi:hypothetical protein